MLTYKGLKGWVSQGGTRTGYRKILIYIGLGSQTDPVVGMGHVNLGFRIWDCGFAFVSEALVSFDLLVPGN